MRGTCSDFSAAGGGFDPGQQVRLGYFSWCGDVLAYWSIAAAAAAAAGHKR